MNGWLSLRVLCVNIRYSGTSTAVNEVWRRGVEREAAQMPGKKAQRGLFDLWQLEPEEDLAKPARNGWK